MTQPVKSIPIDEATIEQKRAFATTFLNLDVASDASETTIDSAIATAQPGIGIIFGFDAPDSEEQEFAAAAAPEAVISGASVGTLGRGDPRYTINIPVVETDDASGEMDVIVGVNGRAWQIKRGVDASVPARVFFGLQNARGITVRHVDDGQGDINEVHTPFQRHGFNVVESPSKAEVDAWLERTGAEFCA